MRTCNGNCVVIPNKLHVLYNFNAARSCNETKRRILYFSLCFLLNFLPHDDVSCLYKFESSRLVLTLIFFCLNCAKILLLPLSLIQIFIYLH